MKSKKQIEERLRIICKESWYVGNKGPEEMLPENKRYWEGYRNALVFVLELRERSGLPWEK